MQVCGRGLCRPSGRPGTLKTSGPLCHVQSLLLSAGTVEPCQPSGFALNLFWSFIASAALLWEPLDTAAMTSHIVVRDLHIIIVCAIAYGCLLAEPAHCFGLASYRAVAVAAVAGYTKRPSWQLPALRARPPLAVWASDDRLGTFVAGHPNAPPLAEDIYKLRLLDEEDQQSAEAQQQSGEVRVCFAVCMQTIDWLFLEAPVFCCAMGI